MIRILQLPGSINLDDGRMSAIMNVYRDIDRKKIQFDFAATKKNGQTFESEIKKLGGRVYILSESKSSLSNIRKLVEKLLQNTDYKYLHYHSISPWGCCLGLAHKYNTKVIVHSHSAGLSDSLIKKIRNRIFSFNIPLFSDKRIAVSPEAGKALFIRQKFTLIPNSIDPNKFSFSLNDRSQIRKKMNIDEDTKVIAIIGHIYKVKNQKMGVEAFNELLNSNNNLLLLIVGSGNTISNSYYSEINQKLKSYDIQKKVKFVGSISNMNEVYSAIDEVWIPSIYEGLPTVALEAQANGLPVVISNNVTKILKVNKNVVFSNLSKSSWINSVKKISLENRDKNAINNFKNSIFNIKRIVKEWEKIYEE